jgi:hypothetical protein
MSKPQNPHLDDRKSAFFDPYRESYDPSRARFMKPLANFLPFLGQENLKTYAPSPVWSGSTTDELKFAPMPKKKATKLWHEARRFERNTRTPGKQDGALGRNGLAVLYVLLFDFLNYSSGRLDPAIATIAKAANISPRSAARGLANLKAWRVINWVRRCVVEVNETGRAVFRQLSNAYAVLSAGQWLGYRPAPEAPPPQSGTWGDHPPLPSVIQEAAAAPTLAAKVEALALDPRDEVAAALARLGASLKARQSDDFTGLPA